MANFLIYPANADKESVVCRGAEAAAHYWELAKTKQDKCTLDDIEPCAKLCLAAVDERPSPDGPPERGRKVKIDYEQFGEQAKGRVDEQL